MNSLLIFNTMLILYNLLFLMYACMCMKSELFYYLIAFLPILDLLQVFIMINFTIRYYKLARIINFYFNSDL